MAAAKLKSIFHYWSSIGFLSITTYRIVLCKARSLTRIGCVSTLSEILQLPIVSTASRNLLGSSNTLHVINSSIRLCVICRNLVRTVPVVTRSPHTCILRLIGVVGLLIVAHSNAVNVLGLSLANDGIIAHGLRHVVGAHRWMLLARSSIVPEIYVIDSTFSHLIFG